MKKFEVYFGEGRLEETIDEGMEFLASFDIFDEAEKFICKRIHEHHQPNYYIRIMKGEKIWWYDYGSHTKFYAIKMG